MVSDECINLVELKEKYKIFKKKYNLPEFSELNKLFDIEDIDVETDFLLRKIRRIISDRIAAYLRFIEIILNPSNAPMFFFKLIKKLDNTDKEVLTELHEILGNFEIEIISLDLDYNEEKEALFINKTVEMFNNEIRTKLLKTADKMSNGVNAKNIKDSQSYFG